jgi:hypothetical protein
MMDRMDQNGDGVIDEGEWPAESPFALADSDTNGDGKVDRAEFMAAISKHMASGGPPRGGPPEGGAGG